jgi:glycosyltransferase involved in cell wall biosynthesis
VIISIIVPAYNEEKLLGDALRTLHASAAAVGQPYEIIVVDDGSTDRTSEIARAHDARVVAVAVRHIAAARNAGARQARGRFLMFVDADTLVPATVLTQAVEALEAGAVGGGAHAVFDAATPPWATRVLAVTLWTMRITKWAAGCFLFARRDAFERVGGFDERFFASEEIHLSRALKKHGRFVIIPGSVITSGRKASVYTLPQATWQFLRLLRPGSTKRRDRLTFWYGKRGD